MDAPLCQRCLWNHGASQSLPSGLSLYGSLLHPGLSPLGSHGTQGAPLEWSGNGCIDSGLPCVLVCARQVLIVVYEFDFAGFSGDSGK